MDPYFIKRLWRRPWLSLCSLILTGVLCFLLCYLSGYQAEQRQKLEETKESFDILCVVTNRRGTQSVSLRMGSSAYYFLTDPEGDMPGLIRDLRATKEFYVISPDLNINDQPMIGVTNERCTEDLDPAMGGSVTLFVPEFYETDGRFCLVSQEAYEALVMDRELEAELNGTEFSEEELWEEAFSIHVTDPFIRIDEEDGWGKGNVELTLAGYYAGSGQSIYIPFRTSQDIAIEISNRTSTDSLAFLAADNEKLEAITEAASEVFGTVDPLADEHSSPRYALTIHDEQYRATVAALEQNIERTSYLLPIVMLLGLGVGFLISFLATRGERRTYALMRTMGMTRGRLTASILREQLVLTLLAAAAIALATGRYLPAGAYLACHAIGCAIAVVRSVRVPPTAILREQE